MNSLPKTCSDCSHYACRIDDHGSYWAPAHCKKALSQNPTPIESLTEKPVVLGGFSNSPPDWCPLRLEEVEAAKTLGLLPKFVCADVPVPTPKKVVS